MNNRRSLIPEFVFLMVSALLLLVPVASLAGSCGLITWSEADVPAYADPSQTYIENDEWNGFTVLSYADYGTEHGYVQLHGGWGRIGVSLIAYEDAEKAAEKYEKNQENFNTANYSRTDLGPTTVLYEGFWDSSGKTAGAAVILELRHDNVLIQVASDLFGTDLPVVSISDSLVQYLEDARAMLDGKCGPTILIEPDPSVGLEFQKNIVKGTGFAVRAEDAQGYLNVDWGTFKVLVAGVDKTQHFVTTAFALTQPLEQEVTDTSMKFLLYPDPLEFMTEENLFNIQFNGVWPVTLEVCNRGGQCGKTEYEIYFGPFVDIRTASDDRCSIDEPFLSLRDVVIGNTGIPTKGALYLGVQRLDGSEVITTYQECAGVNYITCLEWREGIGSLLPEMEFISGIYVEHGVREGSLRIDLISGMDGEANLEDKALTLNPDLQHNLLFTAVEEGSAQFHLGVLPVQLCVSTP